MWKWWLARTNYKYRFDGVAFSEPKQIYGKDCAEIVMCLAAERLHQVKNFWPNPTCRKT